MIKSLLGDFRYGSIGRLPFILIAFGLIFLFLAVAFWLGLSFSLRSVWWVFVPISTLIAFSMLNVVAKRWRSGGFPGWAMAGGSGGIILVVFWAVSTEAGLLALLVCLILALGVPTRYS